MSKTETIAKKDMSWTSFFVILGLIIVFRLFVLEPHNVSGKSMDPTFTDKDYVLVDKISYRFREPKRGDVVVFNPPESLDNPNRFIKRIIAIPGDTVEVKEDGQTYVNGTPITESFVKFLSPKTATSTALAADQYFVMGDNRFVSYDSRYWGPITKSELQGRVIVRLYPFTKMTVFPGAKEYSESK